MTCFDYTVNDKQGLHMRPAGILAKQAGSYPCTITLEKDGKPPVNAKSVFSIMGLSVKQGETIVIRCEGEEEEQAARELQAFLGDLL